MAEDLAASLQHATALLGQDPAAAEARAREILARTPQSLEAQAVLGAALRARGALAEALAVLAPLSAAPDAGWIAAFELARVRLALGDSRGAVAPLRRAVALNPDLTAAWRLLGDVLLVAGDVAGAQAAYDRLPRAQIRGPALAQAADALAEGRLPAAESALKALLDADPGLLGAAQLLAEVLARTRRLPHAEALLAQVLAQAPGFVAARVSLASVLLASGKPAPAAAELQRVLAADPQNVRARAMLAAALAETGDFAGAAGLTQGLLQAFPDQPNAWLLLGNTLRTLGRIDEAVDAYRRCLALEPDRGEAYWALANLKTYRFTAAELAALEAAADRTDLDPADQATLAFSLGKHLEDEGHAAEAMARYARANRLEHDRRGYDPQRLTTLVARTRALVTPAFLRSRAGWGDPRPDPVFIVGMPRSGSTLVDQILASHPAIEGLGELQDLQTLADWIALQPARQGGGYPDALADLPRETAAKLGADYLDWTSAYRRQGRPLFTDKAPWNFQHVALIRLLLPNARIVDVRRHPMACGLSIYRQHFAQGWDFSYDLADIGRAYADYVALMAHVDAVAPGAVCRVIYERLVADPEGEIRRLLDHLGLPFDAACLRFFDNPRAVATPSSEQVRQPIFADAVDHWRAFEAELAPLKAALGPVLDAYPEAPSP
ncbi:tetratricopeptide repeat-containing sulfotransferase family protein [Caulobacter sp. KR2-114]|uniref:tetratricopeptide repeat-containing sulfotransferase family protein n=1 Tax=Caulobacter sp. KR2-114 TaxID=3400912 RepID=UPI003BFDC930